MQGCSERVPEPSFAPVPTQDMYGPPSLNTATMFNALLRASASLFLPCSLFQDPFINDSSPNTSAHHQHCALVGLNVFDSCRHY